jgi:hypothetical protein
VEFVEGSSLGKLSAAIVSLKNAVVILATTNFNKS